MIMVINMLASMAAEKAIKMIDGSLILKRVRDWNGGELKGIKRIDALVQKKGKTCERTIWPNHAIRPKVSSGGTKMSIPEMPNTIITVYKY